MAKIGFIIIYFIIFLSYSYAKDTNHDGMYIFSDDPILVPQKTTHTKSTSKKIKQNYTKTTYNIKKVKKNQLYKKKKPTPKLLTKPKPKTNYISTKKGLNLRDAIIKAVYRNKKLRSLREKVIQAKRVVDQKRALLYPMINIIGSSSKNINSEEDKDIKDNFFKDEAQLSITENLYAGGKTTNDIKDAKARLAAALAKYQQSVEKEILNMIQAYLSVIYEKKSITTNRENIKTLNKILDIVTLKEQSGAATKGDLNYIKSNIENTKSQLVLAESKYKNAISYYEYFVGKIDKGNYPIEENIKVSINPNANIEALVLQNPQLKEIKAKIKSLKYELESKKSRFKPTLDLILTTKHKSSSLEGDPTQDKNSAALSFNYPIYNGGADKARIFETKSKIDEQKYKYIDLKRSLTFNAIQILNNMNSTKESLQHIKNQLNANQKVVDSYWNAFKYGTQDLQALLLAQNALNSSKLNMLNSEKSYINQYFQLLSSVGALLRYFSIKYLVNINTINQRAKISIFRSNIHD